MTRSCWPTSRPAPRRSPTPASRWRRRSRHVGSDDSDAFAVIVNHFKSKGSGTPRPHGQGNANDRSRAPGHVADRLRRRVQDAARGSAGSSWPATSTPTPKRTRSRSSTTAGYTNLESTDDPNEESYNFDGQIGSLDHVLANPAALADVERRRHLDDQRLRDGLQRVQPVQLQRHEPVQRRTRSESSDHNPEIVGIDVPDVGRRPDIQILGTNDFHGRIAERPGVGLRLVRRCWRVRSSSCVRQNPDTVFAAAGDLIGASTFESFIQNDKPTIDALNEAGLDVSAVGNHEFDQGYDDLVEPGDGALRPGRPTPRVGRSGQYIARQHPPQRRRQPRLSWPTWTRTSVDVKVGFVGAVTEHLPELVSPAGIAEIHVTDIVDEVNDDGGRPQGRRCGHGRDAGPRGRAEDRLRHDGRRPDIGLRRDRHRVSTTTSTRSCRGHTHLAYNCSFPVPGWVTEGRAVTERPVVSPASTAWR